MKICNKELCTGCQACVNACPKHCIEMKQGHLLHLYPKINKDICIKCGLCAKVCPVNTSLQRSLPQNTYACWAKDTQEYVSSTSGGVASILSRQTIRNGGVVYGCASLPNLEVKHIRISNEADLHLLKGSKYVQSEIGYVYREVKDDLKCGRIVFFVGTPCQIAGLKSFLGKEYDKLITADLVCHGVPSLGYFKQHIIKKIGGRESSGVSFRKGNGMYVVVVDKQGQELYSSSLWKNRYEDEYYNAFFDGHSYRPSCHQCVFADSKRIGDISLGDFWGLEDPSLPKHEYGISCVLINSTKGRDILEEVKSLLFCYEREFEEALEDNEQLKQPKSASFRNKLFSFFSHFLSMDLSYKIIEFDHIFYVKFLKTIHKK